MLKKTVERLGRKNLKIDPYEFDMTQVNGFRYRCEDALRQVSKIAVREARIKEIKLELINSEKLKAHFAENPKDLEALRHDKPLHVTRAQPHLKHVPEYLKPTGKSKSIATGPKVDVAFRKHFRGRHRPAPNVISYFLITYLICIVEAQ